MALLNQAPGNLASHTMAHGKLNQSNQAPDNQCQGTLTLGNEAGKSGFR